MPNQRSVFLTFPSADDVSDYMRIAADLPKERIPLTGLDFRKKMEREDYLCILPCMNSLDFALAVSELMVKQLEPIAGFSMNSASNSVL